MIYLICYLLLSAIVFISTLYFDAQYIRFDKIMLEYKCSIYNINFNKLCVG